MQLLESDFYGGGGGANYFEFSQNSNLSLVAVRGKAGACLDSIQFLFVDTTNGQYVESPRFGGLGGNEFMYQAPPGQWITKVWFNVGGVINGVKFGTKQGEVSDHYGGGGN